MMARHAWIALAVAGVLGLAACESENVAPASAGPAGAGPATAGAPNAAPQGSNSSGQPVRPRSWAYPPETPAWPPGSP
jgi:hypothetical protein